jgi:hypothetical protein
LCKKTTVDVNYVFEYDGSSETLLHKRECWASSYTITAGHFMRVELYEAVNEHGGLSLGPISASTVLRQVEAQLDQGEPSEREKAYFFSVLAAKLLANGANADSPNSNVRATVHSLLRD